MDLLCSLFCLPSWPLRGPLWPRVSLLRLLCFLSWPLRGLPWPPRGLTLLTLLAVLVPAWPSVAAAWPYFAHFALCPRVALRGRHVALLCSLCFLSWPLRELLWPPHGLASPTLNPVLAPAWLSVAPAWPYLLSLLPVLALAWPWPPAGLAYFASAFGCWTLAGLLSWPLHGLAWPLLSLSWALRNLLRPRMACLALRGLPCLPCFPSRPRHGLLWPSRGLPALPVLALAWPRRPSVGFSCFATCATLGLTRSPMVWPVSWLHLVSGRLEPQASAGGEARAWPNQPTNQPT